MSLFKSAVPVSINAVGFTVEQLEHALDADSGTTLRHFLHVLKAPDDVPRLACVLRSAREAVASYGATLSMPSATFRLVQDSLDKLHDDVAVATAGIPVTYQLDHPLMRRLSAHGPYALCLTLRALTGNDIGVAREAAGLEIALGLATAQCFDNGFATDIRRTLTPELFDTRKTDAKRSQEWTKTYVRKRVKAAKHFESGATPDPESPNGARLFDISAGFELSRKMRFAPPRQRQALLDRRHQTDWQLKASAAALMAQAALYDHTALLILVAFSTGLTLRLTKDIPLAGQVTDDKWFMVLDLDAGVIKTCLDRLFPKAAKPDTGATCFRPANRIVVKPLPVFLWLYLQELYAQCPDAKTLAQLLPDAKMSGRQLTLPDDTSALTPSAKRFLIAAAPFAVNLGVDRLAAALLVSDFSVIPSSKMYYCRASREEIWSASEVLFSALGWGAPAPLVPGLAVGSRIVPAREAVTAWWNWMVADLSVAVPGRHCALKRLADFHNRFARLCASLAILCLAAREAKELRFTTHNLQPGNSFAAFSDKRVGIVPGNLKVPINVLLSAQLRLWLSHCKALRGRLEKMRGPTTRGLKRTLDSYLRGECHPLFFAIDTETGRTLPLGSWDLIRWWPKEYRFSSDLGRHFWEVELRDAGVRSTRIDMLLRHLTLGTEAHCSINADKLSNASAEIISAQERLLKSLGIRPQSGLTAKV